ncbi:MAG: molybdopterin-dependent oxidoreductase, partial [Deltaproteobacteria bacterium]|nr:molybdopterin-dependent oxidoreductase [Deltaproteobacteria bacterium]
MLFGLLLIWKMKAVLCHSFRKRLGEKNFTAQIKLKDNSAGRYFAFQNGKLVSEGKIHPAPDVSMIFREAVAAFRIMTGLRNYLGMINAMKNFQVELEGPDDLSMWFMGTLNEVQSLNGGPAYGVDLGNGVKRYTNNTNGGPVFVYVRNGKIIRIVPIDFEDNDAASWTIKAKGSQLTPKRKTSITPYALASKSLVYSKDRLLYPMKRVDFDPDGERHFSQRGISGYERITWDEALDIVAREIKRVKRDYGPGAILSSSGSHHTWGNLGYWLSSKPRFLNSVGHTHVVHNPDSWEGWYWGAMHHWGNSMRLGASDTYGTIEDCLKESEMIVYWSSDPEATSGVYGAFEGTQRRQWAKDLGIKMVHIDPY